MTEPNLHPKIRYSPDPSKFKYSDKYNDNEYFYRVVIISEKYSNTMIHSEKEWRDIGICMSRGWINTYNTIINKKTIMMFKKPILLE